MAPRLRLVPLLLLLVGPACGGGGDGGSTGPSEPKASRLGFVLEPPSTARNRQPLQTPVAVAVLDQAGQRLHAAGIEVALSVTGQGGGLTGTVRAASDTLGVVTFPGLALAGVAGARRLIATASGLVPDTSTVITVTAGTPARLAIQQGDGIAAPRATTLPVAPAVRLLDVDSNPAIGELVDFVVVSGGGRVTGGRATSAGNGVATVGSWTLGASLGVQYLRAHWVGDTAVAAQFLATAGPGLPFRLAVVAGDSQTVTVGGATAVVPIGEVQDSFGTPVPGVPVQAFTGPGGSSGSLGRLVDTSDVLGRIDVARWQVGTTSGEYSFIWRALRAPFPGYRVVATAVAGPVARLQQIVPSPVDTTITNVGLLVSGVRLLAVDSYGNLASGAEVSLAVARGGGSLSATSAIVGTDGLTAPVDWTLGPVSGMQELSATADTAHGRVFVRTYAAATMIFAAGDSQHTTAGTVLPIDPQVAILDAAGLGVPDVPVSFYTSWGDVNGVSFGDVKVMTDSAGLARVHWRVSPYNVPGIHSMVVHPPPGVVHPPPYEFFAFVSPRAPFALRLADPDSQAIGVGNTFIYPPRVEVSDTFGNPIAGHSVQFRLRPLSGSLQDTLAITDSSGHTVPPGWRVDTIPGYQGVVATAPGLVGSPLTITAIVNVGAPARLTAVAGDSQTGLTREPVAVLPTVRVQDRYNNPIPGLGVAFTPVSGGGTIQNPIPSVDPITDAGGVAHPTAWLLGPFGGANSIRITAGALAIDMVATAIQPPPAVLQSFGGSGYDVRAGLPSPYPLVLRITDSRGYGVPGLTPQAQLTGGGTLALVPTDTSGLSTMTGWSLGPGPNSAMLSVAELPGVTVNFTATGQPGGSAFDITTSTIGTVPGNLSLALQSALTRWREIIVGDLPDQPLTLAAGSCFPGQPAFDGTIDDLLVFVEVLPIDGPGGILGGAGVCVTRQGLGVPVVAVLQLDASDINTGLLPGVVLHELGHALGIGTAWQGRGLVVGAGTASPSYVGGLAKVGYWAEKGGGIGLLLNVPVEGAAGAGSRDVHWAEAVFGAELMTPFIAGPVNPVSLVTIGALQDLGYAVDAAAADPGFSLLRRPSVVSPAVTTPQERPVVGPQYEVRPDGTLIPRP